MTSIRRSTLRGGHAEHPRVTARWRPAPSGQRSPGGWAHSGLLPPPRGPRPQQRRTNGRSKGRHEQPLPAEAPRQCAKACRPRRQCLEVPRARRYRAFRGQDQRRQARQLTSPQEDRTPNTRSARKPQAVALQTDRGSAGRSTHRRAAVHLGACPLAQTGARSAGFGGLTPRSVQGRS